MMGNRQNLPACRCAAARAYALTALRIQAIIIACLLMTPGLAAQERPTKDQVSKWLTDLDAETFETRTNARKELEEHRCYEEVLKKLLEKDGTPEASNACLSIFKSWAKKFNADEFEKLRQVVAKIDPAKVSQDNTAFNELQKLFRHLTQQRAFEHLRSKGVDVASKIGGRGVNVILHHTRWKGVVSDLVAVRYIYEPVDFEFVGCFETRLLDAIAGEHMKAVYLGVGGQRKLTAADAKSLKRCSGLRVLDIRARQPCRELYPVLATLKNLTVLHLPRDVTDRNLAFVGTLSKLETLDFGTGSKKWNGSGLRHLKKLSKLRNLYLGTTKVEAKHLVDLLAIPKLQQLTLNSCSQPDQAMFHISKIKRLRVLDVSGCAITDQGLQLLSGHSRLEHLTLGDPRTLVITDRGVAKLLQNEKLRSIRNRGALISSQMIEKLAKQKVKFYGDRKYRLSAELNREQVEVLRKLFDHGLECSRDINTNGLMLVARKPINRATIELLKKFGESEKPTIDFFYLIDDEQAEHILQLPAYFAIQLERSENISESNIERLRQKFGRKKGVRNLFRKKSS